MLKRKAGSVGVCALFFLFLSSFLPFVFLCCFLAALCGEGVVDYSAGWRVCKHSRSTHLFKPACDVTLLPDGRTLCLKLLQRIELPFPVFSYRSFLSFGPFVPWTSVEFTCGNSLTSFRNCWAFILVYLCIWDPIMNPLIGQDMVKVESYFSVICHVHHPSEALLICTKQAASAKTSPFWRYRHLHLLSSSR